jgi:hypothetical protein
MTLHASRFFGIVALALALAGCPQAPRPAPSETPVTPPAIEAPVRQFPGATRYDVVGKESLVRILAHRGGTLSGVGHNHVIASHDVHGTVYLHDDPAKSGFDLVIPVGLLEVDEPELRNEEGPDYAATVPDNAKAGTRKNMLGPALLDSEHFPGIELSSVEVSGTPEALQALTRIKVKDQAHEFMVPIAVKRDGDRVTGTGELDVKQSELGLKPFSILGGALQVQDQLKIRFTIIATRSKS